MTHIRFMLIDLLLRHVSRFHQIFRLQRIFRNYSQNCLMSMVSTWMGDRLETLEVLLPFGPFKGVYLNEILRFLNKRFLKERGMASTLKMECQVFLCVLQENSTIPLLISTDFLKYPFRQLFQTGIKFQ